jgi:deoxyribose-phosphate aldolase
VETPPVSLRCGRSLLERISRASLAWTIDAALLGPAATRTELESCVADCLELGVKGLCVLPRHLAAARRLIDGAGGGLDLIGVVDFPLGGRPTARKVAEIGELLDAGADELDAVPDLSLLKTRRTRELAAELAELRRAARGRVLKIILECPLLEPEEMARGAELCLEAGAEFVKTATGTRGATRTDHVQVLRNAVGTAMDVKAAGGIRSLNDAAALFEAGANRLGTSRPRELLEEFERRREGGS